MIIDIVTEAGRAVRVLAEHAAKINPGGIRKNDPIPIDLQSPLSIPNRGVVGADQPRSLRYQEILACRGVLYIRRDQSLQFSWQIRIDLLFEHSGNFPSSFGLVFGKGHCPC